MQRDDDPTISIGGYRGHRDTSYHLFGSRRRAFERLRSAVLFGTPSPVLITGEPGAGKTALVRRFAAEDPSRWHTVTVVLAAELNAIEFLRLVGHALGLGSTSRLGKARLRLERALAREAAEGRRWLLVVDRADRGRSGVWDEVQAIANGLGRSQGFAALFIVGDTGLARSLASRRSSVGLISQARTHIHLKPLDLDEARDLLDSTDVADVAEQAMLEELYRNSHGNTALLLRLAQAWSQRHRALAGPGGDRAARTDARERQRGDVAVPADPSGLSGEAQPDSSREVVKEQSGTTTRVGRGRARTEAPPLFPSKPPIRDEDGLVEVGWEGELEDEQSGAQRASTDSAAFVADLSPLEDELIEDACAALEAESELSRNQALMGSAAAAHPDEIPEEMPEAAGRSGEARTPTAESATGIPPLGIRAESQHEFAPYGQLFTRYRQSN
jgi:general secretion pathway protein A